MWCYMQVMLLNWCKFIVIYLCFQWFYCLHTKNENMVNALAVCQQMCQILNMKQMKTFRLVNILRISLCSIFLYVAGALFIVFFISVSRFFVTNEIDGINKRWNNRIHQKIFSTYPPSHHDSNINFFFGDTNTRNEKWYQGDFFSVWLLLLGPFFEENNIWTNAKCWKMHNSHSQSFSFETIQMENRHYNDDGVLVSDYFFLSFAKSKIVWELVFFLSFCLRVSIDPSLLCQSIIDEPLHNKFVLFYLFYFFFYTWCIAKSACYSQRLKTIQKIHKTFIFYI